MQDQPNAEPRGPETTMRPIGTQISTDRLCATCGFNLFGQMIQREPHYGLIVARCPECGTIASLQEYPAMTNWVGRWRLALAGIWVVLLMGALFAHFGISTAFNQSALQLVAENYSNAIGDAFNTDDTSKTTGFQTSGQWAWVDAAWADAHAPRILEEMGGVIAGANREVLWIWIAMVLVSMLAGVFWTTVLLGATRKRAIVVPLVAICVSGTILFLTEVAVRSNGNIWANSIGKEAFGVVFVPLNTLIMAAGCAIGVFAGRPVVRFALCIMLPPRLRTPLAVFWTRDGLTPPESRSY